MDHTFFSKQMKTFLLICILLFSKLGFAQKASPESDVRVEAQRLFQAEKYDDLDMLAARYLKSQEKIPNGLWKFSELYEGAEAAMDPPAHLRNFMELDEHWIKVQEKINRWIKHAPLSVFAKILRSRAYTNQAWSYRGTGLSASVKEDAWINFNKYIKKSKENLILIQPKATTDPYWYCEMLVVAKAEGWENEAFFKIFNEGILKHPNFYPLYSYASSKLLPQWGGSVAAIENFAEFSAKNSNNKDGKSFYARVFWSAYQSRLPNSFIKNEKTWPRIKESFDYLIKAYPDPWNLYNYARFSCMAGDRMNLKRIVSLIGSGEEIDRNAKPEVNPWGKNFYSQCVEWAGADAK